MAKIEIEISDYAAELVNREAQRVGTPTSKVIEVAVECLYGAGQALTAAEDVYDHEKWLKRFTAWQAQLSKVDHHLSNEDLRRVNMYDDERG